MREDTRNRRKEVQEEGKTEVQEEVLKLTGVDRSDQTFANGGPVTNRQKKDPLQGLDFEFDVVGVPGSPVGFSVLKYRKTQDQPDQFQQENIAVFDSGYDADRPKV